MAFNPTEHPHQRYNPLKDEWVLISPHRTKRPWSGQKELSTLKDKSKTSPLGPTAPSVNPLCPGATRANGEVNPNYTSTFVFDNDFPAMMPDTPEPPDTGSQSQLFCTRAAQGRCRVLCFHPDPSKTISRMTLQEVTRVVDLWVEETRLLQNHQWVQIFENRGAAMGCSNPHPHCQIWASNFIPNEARIKNETQLKYYKKYGSPMLKDYAKEELVKKERVVISNDHWVVLVPFWAVWPFETMVLPLHGNIRRITDMNLEEHEALADVMKRLTIKYDNLFETDFPYSMGWHGAPTGKSLDDDVSHWVFHGMYFPPLLRSATVKKFMVGYELLAQAQRDLTAEQAAERLRQMSDVHYTCTCLD